MPLSTLASTARGAALAGLAAVVPGLAWAQADTVLRFRCALVDGSTHVLPEDLSLKHPGMVTGCEPVRIAAATLRSEGIKEEPVGARRAWMQVIEAPASWAGRAAAAAVTSVAAMPAEVAQLVKTASQRHQLDPALVSALIYVESRFRPDARSPKGAMGLMQLMPATAARYGVRSASELLDPRTNVDVGVRHLRSLHDRYEGRVDLMLAAYNAGEGAVSRYGNQIPPYAETQSYVRQITELATRP